MYTAAYRDLDLFLYLSKESPVRVEIIRDMLQKLTMGKESIYGRFGQQDDVHGAESDGWCQKRTDASGGL